MKNHVMNKAKNLVYKFFAYLIIFAHLNWSQLAIAGGLGETLLEDNNFSKSIGVYKDLRTQEKKRKINLEKSEDNFFYVPFDQHSTIGCTEYYNADTLIARISVKRSQVNFEGFGSHQFVVSGPVNTQSLTCMLDGSLAFLEDVTLASLRLKSGGLTKFAKKLSVNESANITAQNITINGPISTGVLNLTTKENACLFGDVNAHRAFFRIGETLEMGSDGNTLHCKVMNDIGVRAKKVISHGKIHSDSGKIVLQAEEVHISNMGALKAKEKLMLKSNILKNEGKIKGRSESNITNHTFYNSGRIKTSGHFQLENHDFFENSGSFYSENSIVKAKLLSNLGKWEAQGKTDFSLTEDLYNSGELRLLGNTTLQSPLFSNYGKMAFMHSAILRGDSFNNDGVVFLEGFLDFSLSQDLLNQKKGNLTGKGVLKGKYRNLHNKGKWHLEGTFVSEGTQLLNDHGAQWHIGDLWQHKSKDLILDGSVNAGALAIFDVEGSAKFSGFIHVGALQVSSDSSITCNRSSHFDITHHFSLKAKHSIDFDSQVLDRRARMSETTSGGLKEHISSLPKGVFFTAGKYLKKDGRIVAEHGSVSLESGGQFRHLGLTESGLNSGDSLFLTTEKTLEIDGFLKSHKLLKINAEEDIKIKKGANLEAKKGELKAKKNIASEATINMQKSLATRSLYLTNQGTIKGKNLHFKTDRVFSNVLGGVIEGEDTKIDALISVNSLAYMTSRNLTINSALDLNLGGVRSAFNARINSLVTINGGLNLPRIDSWEDAFTGENLKNAGHSLFTTFAPQSFCLLYNVGRSLWRLPELWRQTKKLWNDMQSLKQQEDIGVSDFIPILCGFKDAATTAIQTYSGIKEVHKSYKEGKYTKDTLKEWKNSSVASFESLRKLPKASYQAYQQGKLLDHLTTFKDPALSTLGTVVGSFGPHYNTDSFLNLNMGANLGVNGYERSLATYNYGFNGFANTYTLDTAYGENKGVLASSRLRVEGYRGYDNEGKLFGFKGSVHGGDIHLGGQVGFYGSFSASGNNVVVDGTHKGEELSYNAKENLTTIAGSSITGDVVVAKAGNRASIGGEVNGKKYAQVFGAQETTVTSTGAVKGEKERHVGIDFQAAKNEASQVLKNEKGESQSVPVYSQKTDLQGKIQDTSTQDHSKSHTLIGGHQVDIKGQAQTHGRTDVEALENLHIHKGASLTGKDVSAKAKKGVFQDGMIDARENAVVLGTEKTSLGKNSITKAKQASVGKATYQTTDQDGNEVSEVTQSKTTEVAQGAQIKSENSQTGGDDLTFAGKVESKYVSISSNNGDILNPQDIHATTADIALGKYKGGAQGAIDTANGMTHVQAAYIDASQEDFVNNKDQTFQQDLQFVFNRIDNSAKLNSEKSLSLDGIHGLKTTNDIHAETGLTTLSSQGKHETLNGAVLSTSKGTNLVKGAKGLVQQSILKDGAIKRAGQVGDRVIRITEGDFDNTAGQTIAHQELISIIGGNQNEHAIVCPNGTTSLGIDGHKRVLHGGKKAHATLARTEDHSKGTTYEEINGKLTTKAGIRRADKGGILIARKGIDAKTLHHTYKDKEGSRRSGLFGHKKEKWVRENTDFYRPEFHSRYEKFDVSSTEGKTSLKGVLFDVAKTSNIYGRDGVDLPASVARNHYRGSESSCFGLSQKTYKGSQDCAQVAEVIGREKINIITERGPITLQSPILNFAQGGGFFTPEGIVRQPLILESEHKERRQGLVFTWAGNRPLKEIHPLVHRTRSLLEGEDGVTGRLSDLGGLVSSAFNTTTHAAQSYNMRESALSFVSTEAGLARISLGFEDVQTKSRNRQEIPGLLYSGGDFTIQTNKGKEADLRNMNVSIDTLYLDTDKLLLAGSKQTTHQQDQSYSTSLLYDAFSPTTLTVSGNHHSSDVRATEYTQTDARIGHLHIIRPETEINTQNANLLVNHSTSETYYIQVNDQQNQLHSRAYHGGFSVAMDMLTGVPVGGGGSVGNSNFDSYTTPHRSEVRVNTGDNLPETLETKKEDRIEGEAFSVSYTKPSEGASLSMPLSVSGQVGETKFRVEPLLVNKEAIERDIGTIQRAGQLISESFQRENTREFLGEKVREECLSHGLSQKEAENTKDQMLKAYDQVHSETDENGLKQPRFLNSEGPVFVDEKGELRGEYAQELKISLAQHQKQSQGVTPNLTPPILEQQEDVSNVSPSTSTVEENNESIPSLFSPTLIKDENPSIQPTGNSDSRANDKPVEDPTHEVSKTKILPNNPIEKQEDESVKVSNDSVPQASQHLKREDSLLLTKEENSTTLEAKKSKEEPIKSLEDIATNSKESSKTSSQANRINDVTLGQNSEEKEWFGKEEHTPFVKGMISAINGLGQASTYAEECLSGKHSCVQQSIENGSWEKMTLLQQIFTINADSELIASAANLKFTEGVLKGIGHVYDNTLGWLYRKTIASYVEQGTHEGAKALAHSLYSSGCSKAVAQDIAEGVEYTANFLAEGLITTGVLKGTTKLVQTTKSAGRARNVAALDLAESTSVVKKLPTGHIEKGVLIQTTAETSSKSLKASMKTVDNCKIGKPPSASPSLEKIFSGQSTAINCCGESNCLTQIKIFENRQFAERIANHSLEKHLLNGVGNKKKFLRIREDFPGWIRTKNQLKNHAETILSHPTEIKTLQEGRVAYWHEPSSTIVIKNPNALDGGTIFQPIDGYQYFKNQIK
jgi:hypothetical protein